jgi:hypothetical protein
VKTENVKGERHGSPSGDRRFSVSNPYRFAASVHPIVILFRGYSVVSGWKLLTAEST